MTATIISRPDLFPARPSACRHARMPLITRGMKVIARPERRYVPALGIVVDIVKDGPGQVAYILLCRNGAKRFARRIDLQIVEQDLKNFAQHNIAETAVPRFAYCYRNRQPTRCTLIDDKSVHYRTTSA